MSRENEGINPASRLLGCVIAFQDGTPEIGLHGLLRHGTWSWSTIHVMISIKLEIAGATMFLSQLAQLRQDLLIHLSETPRTTFS